jgi:hypothetical protein
MKKVRMGVKRVLKGGYGPRMMGCMVKCDKLVT